MPGESDSNEERQARSLALEKAYVHDVYDQIAPHFTDTRYRAWPRVKQFLLDLEPASLVADVGCGNGKYLDINPEVMKVGSDRCAALTAAARSKNHEVITCDNLQLPFRDETFDAALSVAVIHHFATTDRRVAALKELARVLRIGGKVLITVWAMEQRHRKFDSQDVLVPWHEPVKSSSEDRGSSMERDLTSTTTSDDDVLVYHAYSHISDSETQPSPNATNINRRRQKFRNGRGRYRSAGSFENHSCAAAANSSQSSSELSSPNETCYSFVKRALQKLSNTASTPYNKKSSPKPYFYRSCRKPCISDSMEFGTQLHDSDQLSPRRDLFHQDSIESEYQDHLEDDDVPIEIRHLEGYEPCLHCGNSLRDNDTDRCERHVCSSCLPIESDAGNKKSRSLGDFFNLIPKLLRVKKFEKEPLSDLHKRISTASDPREYVVKSRGANVNGIVRSKSTVSFMSRLEELMSLSAADDRQEYDSKKSSGTSDSGTCVKVKVKPSRLPSLTSSTLTDGECTLILRETDMSTNPRRYNSPADALRKLRQDASLEEPNYSLAGSNANKLSQIDSSSVFAPQGSAQSFSVNSVLEAKDPQELNDSPSKRSLGPKTESEIKMFNQNNQETEVTEESNSTESHLSSYYSMPELYKFSDDQIPEEEIFNPQRQRHISFYEQAETVLAECETADQSNEIRLRRHDSSPSSIRERISMNSPQRGLVKRSLSVDTGDNTSSSHQGPRRFSASAAQGVLASALRTYTLPRSSSRGSSVKSDTSIDSEESIVSVIPRKGNSITSDTSVDSEESVISVIQRSTSEIETLVRENGLRNISRLGSRSAQASPVTVLSSQTSSAESSPPQSGKNDGRFPGTGGVIDQLMQQQFMHASQIQIPDVPHGRQDIPEHLQRTRRCLLRPISDPKIEDKLNAGFLEDGSMFVKAGRRTPSNKSSLEGDDNIIREDEEKTEILLEQATTFPTSSKSPLRFSNSALKPLEEIEIKPTELSQTPSPVGPFKYINDPLLVDNLTTHSIAKAVENFYSHLTPDSKRGKRFDGVDSVSTNSCSCISEQVDKNSDHISEEPKICHLSNFGSSQLLGHETTLQQRLEGMTLQQILDETVLRHVPSEKASQRASDETISQHDLKHAQKGATLKHILDEKMLRYTADQTMCGSYSSGLKDGISPSSVRSKTVENRGWNEIAEREGTSDILSNRTTEWESLNQISLLDSQGQPTAPVSKIDSDNGSSASYSGFNVDIKYNILNESSANEGDEHREVKANAKHTTRDHESMFKSISLSKTRYVNGGSSSAFSQRFSDICYVKPKMNLAGYKEDMRYEVSLRCSELPETSTKETEDRNNLNQNFGRNMNGCTRTSSDAPELNDAEGNDYKETQRERFSKTSIPASRVLSKDCESQCQEKSSESNGQSVNTNDASRVKSSPRKPLKRSCVTIDEVECREVASSEETSPSLSSPSLEWNDFDKVDAPDNDGLDTKDSKTKLACGGGVSANGQRDVTSPEACCGDVNVAETENKFNVFLDKEICVFFETPSSSIGKSASSSSNATDFSTTSERIRGVVQREKSDDRSSKESDSDNLSKLSDLEAKSDSAFSEDFARRTDFASSSSSASLEMMDSIRSKLGNDASQSWVDCEPISNSAKERQASSWVLDNIDEIPDDEKNDEAGVTYPEGCDDTSRTDAREWSDDQALSFVQRRENFLNCAADCRDMYRISFDDSSPKSSPSEDGAANGASEKIQQVDENAANYAVPIVPQLPVFQNPIRDAEENEAPTDILAAFVETISDLTSVFGELYPRHEGKFEDFSSDDSLEISSFERILTASDPQPIQEKDKKMCNEVEFKNFDFKKGAPSVSVGHVMPNVSRRDRPTKDVKCPPRKFDCHSKRHVEDSQQIPSLEKKGFPLNKKIQNSEKAPEKKHPVVSEWNGTKESSNTSVHPCVTDKSSENVSRSSNPNKIFNHSSQSVCADEEEVEDCDTAGASQSAPCSPQLHPRQRSVEEVTSAKGDLSRNSSLSQSTSQESLPGNESGGLMAYHRYYHVFRQGELDNLIENYVDNLHIIASYYDHANWCVVAEKVQVWTI